MVFAQQTPSAVPLMIPVSSNSTDLILSWTPVTADIYANERAKAAGATLPTVSFILSRNSF